MPAGDCVSRIADNYSPNGDLLQTGSRHQDAKEELQALREICEKVIAENVQLGDELQALAHETGALKADKLSLEEHAKHLLAEVGPLHGTSCGEGLTWSDDWARGTGSSTGNTKTW